MKIGLEFEGVIRDRTTGEIARWSKIPESVKIRIKKLMFVRRPAVEPTDRYDVLAEVRTPPLLNPSIETLIVELFSEMERAAHAFSANGYDIQWWEQSIPQSLHDEILRDFNVGDPDGKQNKYTQTIRNGKIEKFESVGNLFRGGGLHITISSIPNLLAPTLVSELHKSLERWNSLGHFQSHYRNNLLFRTRYEDKENDEIVEYMPYGFNIQNLSNWKEKFEIVRTHKWNSQSCDDGDVSPFIWAQVVTGVLRNFYHSCNKIR